MNNDSPSNINRMKFRNRNFVSITISIGFLSVAITGLLYFFGVKSNAVEAIHVLFGLIFTFFIGFHIFYNFSSIKNYTVNKKTREIKKEMIWGVAFSVVLLCFMSFGGGLATAIAESGRELFSERKRENNRHHDGAVVFKKIDTNEKLTGTNLQFIIHEQRNVIAPVVVIWAVDSTGKNAESLFYPSKTMQVPAVASHLEDFERKDIVTAITYKRFTDSLLPAFKKVSRHLIPNYENATPVNNFILTTKTTFSKLFTVFLEIEYNGKIALYSAYIDTSVSKVFLLKSSENSLIEVGIVNVI